jgi:hypothetical protein
MLRRLILRLAPAVALSALALAPLSAQTPASTRDRWQLTLDDQSYLWNVRLIRLSHDTLTVRTRDSLVATPIRDISTIQLLAETILRVGDGHRSGIGALGDNNSPVLDLTSLALAARRQRIQALLDHEAAHARPGAYR